MSRWKRKQKRQGGFTLIEMLIVVAIIAILVAVSIPLINSSLERARIATDAANERAAKAEILLAYLTDDYFSPGSTVEKGTTYYYDAALGKIVTAVTSINEYGKCTEKLDGSNSHKNRIIKVVLENDESVTIRWVLKSSPETRGLDPHGDIVD